MRRPQTPWHVFRKGSWQDLPNGNMETGEYYGSEQLMEMIAEEAPISDAQALIWALLDEQICESDFVRLEGMLRSDAEVRRLYVQCVQMHIDLQQWFSRNAAAGSGSSSGIVLEMPLPGESPVADPAF
jgi:hypothetical protein